jgi:hypothetical protein
MMGYSTNLSNTALEITLVVLAEVSPHTDFLNGYVFSLTVTVCAGE